MLPGEILLYPYRAVGILPSPITPLYTIVDSGRKLEGHNPKQLANQYCTAQAESTPPLASDVHHIEERVMLTMSIWGLIQGAREKAALWGLSKAAKGKRKCDEEDDDEKGLSEGPRTRSRSSVTSSQHSMNRGQGEEKGKGKQKAQYNPGTKCKMDSAWSTGEALQRLEKRQRLYNQKAIGQWAEKVHLLH